MIEKFTDLNTWKEGHTLVLLIYNFSRLFPRNELFGLVSQMRRSAVSVTSNIAEGFGRQSIREKIQFYYVARGSLTELQNQLIIARDLSFLSQEDFCKLYSQSVIVHKLVTGLLKKTKSYLVLK